MDKKNNIFTAENEPLKANEPEKDVNKTNLYRTRIVETEINSGLFFQQLIHYNYYATIIFFAFQIFSISFKVRKLVYIRFGLLNGLISI